MFEIPPDTGKYKELEEKLKQAAKQPMTKAEKREQKISWVYGQMNGEMPRDEITRIIDEKEGV